MFDVSSIKKTVLLAGKEHYISVESSLDLEGIEISGCDPESGKTIHISLSPLMKQPRDEQSKYDNLESEQTFDMNEPMKSLDMFSIDEPQKEIEQNEQILPQMRTKKQDEKNDSNVINDLFD